MKRDGTELYYEGSVSIVQAALGTTLIVPTVEGDEEVEVKAGTQPGTEIRLRGRGVPHLRRNGVRGDLHVMVDVAVPTRLSKKERELLEAYAEEAGEAVASGGGFIDKVLGKKSKGSSEGVVEAVVTAFWLEISVEADTEAVEAVSEILGRVAPAGTSVEPGFELVDEGLGARVDPARSAIVRAYVEASDPEAVERTIEEVTQALGHLQVFDLRPIGEVATRLIDEADWAEEWKRALPGAPRRPAARDPADVAPPSLRRPAMWCSRSTRGWPSGRASTRRRGCASQRSRASPIAAGSRDARSSTSAAARGSWRSPRSGSVPRRRSASTPIRSRSRRRPRTRAGTGLPGGSAPARAALPTGEGPFDVVLANLIASLLVRLAPELRAELAPGGTLLASGIFVDREAEVRDAFELVGLRITSRLAEGDWIALEAVRAG